ncbi:unnamed protein product [Tenebrio molitor]|nr:unnamed protein product [Tenebrio molitor]
MVSKAKILFVEPFYGGSHKALIDNLTANLNDYQVITLPAKKWHWRARCGALMIHELIPPITTEKILFCSSVLNLAELLGIRPDLHILKKVVYFHENQLIYPVREVKDRDIQYAYNEITTCLAADIILFNSNFNKISFLENIKKILKILPDWRPKNLESKIEKKSQVIYFPVAFPRISLCEVSNTTLHIVWPHRWEFDKGPDDFFSVLFKLKENKFPFKVSILGEFFTDNPLIFSKAKDILKDEIINFGYVDNKADYYDILASAHVVVSTAKHEFFGVAVLEAVYCGCYPLLPNSLVYPELYPAECLFSDLDDLYIKLRDFCSNPKSAREARHKMFLNFEKYSSITVVSNIMKIINTFQYFCFIKRKSFTSDVGIVFY